MTSLSRRHRLGKCCMPGCVAVPNSCVFGRSTPRFTTGLTAADDLLYSDGFAFLLACCLDRGMQSEIIGRIPYYLKRLVRRDQPRT